MSEHESQAVAYPRLDAALTVEREVARQGLDILERCL